MIKYLQKGRPILFAYIFNAVIDEVRTKLGLVKSTTYTKKKESFGSFQH